MSSVNKVVLVGRVGGNPDVKVFDNGVKKVDLSLATSEYWKEGSEKKERTEWHRLVCWRNVADIVESWVKKGDLIYIEGKLRTRSWGEGTEKRWMTEVHVDSIQMLGGGSVKNESVDDDFVAPRDKGVALGAPKAKAGGVEGDDDLPF